MRRSMVSGSSIGAVDDVALVSVIRGQADRPQPRPTTRSPVVPGPAVLAPVPACDNRTVPPLAWFDAAEQAARVERARAAMAAAGLDALWLTAEANYSYLIGHQTG